MDIKVNMCIGVKNEKNYLKEEMKDRGKKEKKDSKKR